MRQGVLCLLKDIASNNAQNSSEEILQVFSFAAKTFPVTCANVRDRNHDMDAENLITEIIRLKKSPSFVETSVKHFEREADFAKLNNKPMLSTRLKKLSKTIDSTFNETKSPKATPRQELKAKLNSFMKSANVAVNAEAPSPIQTKIQFADTESENKDKLSAKSDNTEFLDIFQRTLKNIKKNYTKKSERDEALKNFDTACDVAKARKCTITLLNCIDLITIRAEELTEKGSDNESARMLADEAEALNKYMKKIGGTPASFAENAKIIPLNVPAGISESSQPKQNLA